MHKTCFVMQCFDSGPYDRRYRDTFAPAIESAGAKPVRADEVLGTTPVIEKIEAGLRKADIAFAEISENNPNVFLELGYALSLTIPTVIVCDRSKRPKLPFDIAHRPVIFYSTDSQSDWEKAAEAVRNGISAALLESVERRPEGATAEPENAWTIDEIKSACLLELLDADLRSPNGSSLWEIQKAVAKDGISERMVGLAIASLSVDGLINRQQQADYNGNDFITFTLTAEGNTFLLRSYSSLVQQERQRLASVSKPFGGGFPDNLDDDVPF